MGLVQPFPAGGGITAAALAAVAPLAGLKLGDQAAPQSSTVLVSDNDLVLGLLAAGAYAGFGMIVFSAGTSANYKATFTVPAAATGGWSPNPYVATNGNYQANPAFLAFGTTIAVNGQGTASNLAFGVQFSVVMGAAAGNLQYQFAQNSSDASDLNTRAGSYLLAWKVA